MSTPIKPKTGITAETYQRLLTDSGLVYVNFGEVDERIIGATRGGNQFVIEDENREMIADGSPGPVVGSQRRTKSTAKLTINFLEMTSENIKLFLPGSTFTSDVSGDTITRDCQISAGDYVKNLTLCIAKNATEEPLAIKLTNALCLSGLDLSAAEDDETVITAEFTAHYDPANLALEPWEIFNPAEVPVIIHDLAYTAGANGSLIGDALQQVADGEDGTAIYADADDLYEFTSWTDASTDNPRTDLAVSGDITQTANFALI